MRGSREILLTVLLPGWMAAQAPAPLREIPGAPPATYADPRSAAAALEALAEGDSLNGGLAWRAAVALVAAARGGPGDTLPADRDSLYRRAEAQARRAVRLVPDEAQAHFALAMALGRASLARGVRDRVRDAVEIRAEAERAIALDPGHDGAWHVLGSWHAEVRRLSGLSRFVARTLLGGRVLGEATWEAAIRYLERAVELRPDWIAHRFDLAEVLLERGLTDRGRAQLEAVLRLPARDLLDPEYRSRAAAMLETLRRGEST